MLRTIADAVSGDRVDVAVSVVDQLPKHGRRAGGPAPAVLGAEGPELEAEGATLPHTSLNTWIYCVLFLVLQLHGNH